MIIIDQEVKIIGNDPLHQARVLLLHHYKYHSVQHI